MRFLSSRNLCPGSLPIKQSYLKLTLKICVKTTADLGKGIFWNQLGNVLKQIDGKQIVGGVHADPTFLYVNINQDGTMVEISS